MVSYPHLPYLSSVGDMATRKKAVRPKSETILSPFLDRCAAHVQILHRNKLDVRERLCVSGMVNDSLFLAKFGLFTQHRRPQFSRSQRVEPRDVSGTRALRSINRNDMKRYEWRRSGAHPRLFHVKTQRDER